MPDREKTIKELDRITAVLFDAVTLLKEKKEVKPRMTVGGFMCCSCGCSLVTHASFCHNCGAAVKWE